ncbi:uncharacterized membrane protein (UPF0136 family) [Methanofollis sp. W23]|uniref:hypothetical protein n=1 Tax=Methanofollis sp. W23 TaxID=2817849 RepID=UPI001AE30E21|nr:hypothetical protein [Methanofollis sp. W23]MBP2145390.1 uncharacterized membrane protein (UPF0136 family) [Methanofollis sp. W23]
MIEPDTRALLFTRRTTRSQALDAVRAWWGGRLMAGDLRDQAEVIECRLKYVPFWRLTARVKGRVEGYRMEYDEYLREKIPMKTTFDRDFVWTGAACDTSALGIFYLRNLFGETVPSGLFTGQVTVSQDEGIAEGKRALKYGAQRYSGIPHVTGHRIFLWHPEIALLIYPFWTVRYLYAGRPYFAAVDGVTGTLVAGRAPGNLFWRIVAFVTATGVSVLAVAAWVVFLERSIFRDGGPVSDSDLGLLILLLPMVMLCGWGLVLDAFAFSRHGAEITAGDLYGGYRRHPETPPPEQTTLTAGVVLGFLFMILGVLLFSHWGMWQGLVVAVAGGTGYLIACTSRYNPAWETAGRREGRDTSPLQREEEW